MSHTINRLYFIITFYIIMITLSRNFVIDYIGVQRNIVIDHYDN